jgi:hypothetical protein
MQLKQTKNGIGRKKKSKYALVTPTKYHEILDIKNDWWHVQSMILEDCQLWIPVVSCEQLSAYQRFCSKQFVVVCCAFPIKPNCCSYEHHYWIWSVLRKPHYAHFILLLIKNYVRNTQNLLSALYKTLWCIEYIALSEKNNIELSNSYIHTRQSHTDLPTNPSETFWKHISLNM